MKRRDIENKKTVLDALACEDIDEAASQLAALRAYTQHPNDTAFESQLTFDSICSKVDMRTPWYRQVAVRRTLGGFGLVAATAILLVIFWPQSQPTMSIRLKGDRACCGVVTIRLGIDHHGTKVPLPSKTVAQGTKLVANMLLSNPGWASLYDIHLAKKTIRFLQTARRFDHPASVQSEPISFSLHTKGKHILLLVVTPHERTLVDSEVIDLLVTLGEGVDPKVDGQPCSIDIYQVEVGS